MFHDKFQKQIESSLDKVFKTHVKSFSYEEVEGYAMDILPKYRKAGYKPFRIRKEVKEFGLDPELPMAMPPKPDFKPLYIFKVLKDNKISNPNGSRTKTTDYPYGGFLRYSQLDYVRPSKKIQPYKVVVVNLELNEEMATGGDTPHFRVSIVENMLTAALDWAAINKLPLPVEGTEIYFHSGDNMSKWLARTGVPICCFCRLKKYSSNVILLPDYSFNCFTRAGRFEPEKSACVKWDDMKDIIQQTNNKIPLSCRKNKIFFRGAAFSTTYIREYLSFISKKQQVFGLPNGVLEVDVPEERGKCATNLLPVEELGQFRYLLDLPGYGMWSTRLKFILMSGSIVIRVIQIDTHWNTEKQDWNSEINLNYLNETFLETAIPIGSYHTIIAPFYTTSGIDTKPFSKKEINERADKLNREQNGKVLKEIIKLYNKCEKNLEEEQKRNTQIIKTLNKLTTDRINQYLYKYMMYMSAFFS